MKTFTLLLLIIGLFQFSYGQVEEVPDTSGWQTTPELPAERIMEMMGQATIGSGTTVGLTEESFIMSSMASASPTQGAALPQKSFKTAPTPVVAGNSADKITPEIEALARGLQYDPLTIFNWVRNHIDYECYYGSKKGAHLTLMEMGGNDYDQASLMIALLRVSGYAAAYSAGPVGFSYEYLCSATGLNDPYGDLSDVEFAAKISTPTNPVSPTDPNLDNLRQHHGVANYFTTRGFPRVDSVNGAVFTISHVWVRFTHESQVLNVSPSVKLYSREAAPVLTPTGMNKTALLTAAAATIDTIDGTKWVKNISYANLSSLLSTYTNQMVAEIKLNHDGASMDALLGKPKIIPLFHQNFSSIIQITESTPEWAALETWNESAIPTGRMAHLILLGGDNAVSGVIFNTISSKPLYQRTMPLSEWAGRKFSLTYSGASYRTADFSLDNVVDSTFPLRSDFMFLKVAIYQPHFSFVRNTQGQLVRDTVARNGTDQITRYSCGINPFTYPGNTVPFSYVIMSSFENPRKLLRKRLEILESLHKSGALDTDHNVRTELLYVMGLDWFDQTWRYSKFSSSRNGILPVYHNRIGTVAQQGGYYIDVPLQLTSVNSKQMNAAKAVAFTGQQSLVRSAMEHAVVNQNVGRPVAVSTVEMLWQANSAGEEIYRMSSSSWTAEKSNLSNYILSDTSFLNDKFTPAGTIGLLPKTGNRLVNQWRRVGYAVFTADQVTGDQLNWMKITGGLNGGYGTISEYMTSNPLLNFLRSTPAYDSSASNVINVPITPHTTPKQVSWDPVDMLSGAFLYEKNDLSVPRQSFVRHYNSHLRHNDVSGLGNGWTHDHDIRLAERSSTLAALGETNSYQSAATYISSLAMEMAYDTSNARDWTLAALIAHWAADRTFYKAVGITFGNKTIEFIRLPDGSFLPPPGMNYTLTKTGGTAPTATTPGVLGTYTMAERNGKTYRFNTKGRIDRITDPNDIIQQFNYNGSDQLTTVTDGFNHTFTYTWNAGKISSITDGTDRSVSFVYTSGNLTSVTDVAGSIWTYRYDTSNRLDRITDPALRTTIENTYDGSNRIATQRSMGDALKTWCYGWTGFQNLEENPNGNITAYHYDARGRSIGTTDPLGNTSRVSYDGQDRITSTIDAKDHTTTRVWNNQNNLVSETDPLDQISSYFYDANQRLQRIHDKRGHDTTFIYTANHQLEKVTDPENRVVTNTYNKRRQLLTTTLPTVPGQAAAVITNVYDNSGNLQSTTDAKGYVTSHTWNALANPVTSTLPALTAGNNVITTTYDLRDWATSSSNSLSHNMVTEYDAAKRPTAVIDPLMRRAETIFDPNGQATETKDPLNRINKQIWNARGEKERGTDALNKNTDFLYDGNGNMTKRTNRRGKFYQFAYDIANRLTSTTTPTSKVTLMTYFNNNLVKKITEPSAQATDLTYDARNLLETKVDPTAAIRYIYDSSGLLLKVKQTTGTIPPSVTDLIAPTISRTYDERGRLKTFTTADGDFIQYQYDANNNLTRLTYPDDTPADTTDDKHVYYSYNARNLLESVTDWSNRVTTYQYDRLGRLIGTTRPNGTSNQIVHDAANQLTSIKESSAGKLISYLAFQHDNASQITSRFRAPIVSAGWQHPTFAATYDDDNRHATVNGSLVTHDVDGNMTYGPIKASAGVPPASINLTYNSRNQLTHAAGISYTYDAEGRRRTLTDTSGTTRDIIDFSGKLLSRINPDSTRTYYIYGLGLLYEARKVGTAPETTKTYHFDQVGSTIVRTNDAGSVIGKAEYSAYGLITWKDGDMATPFLYNGQAGVQTDPNGLLNMRARYYSPYLMRFLNADPIGFSGGSNWFAYADGNPISLSDPFGLCAESGNWLSGMDSMLAPAGDWMASMFGSPPNSLVIAGEAAGATLDGWIPFANPIGDSGGYDYSSYAFSRGAGTVGLGAAGLAFSGAAYSAYLANPYAVMGYSEAGIGIGAGVAGYDGLPNFGAAGGGGSSAAQGAMLRMQLVAEEVAGARLPQSLTGYTKHGINQAISRDGFGVSPATILDAFNNPTSVIGQTGKYGGAFQMTGKNGVIVVNPQGQIITTWGTNSAGLRAP